MTRVHALVLLALLAPRLAGAVPREIPGAGKPGAPKAVELPPLPAVAVPGAPAVPETAPGAPGAPAAPPLSPAPAAVAPAAPISPLAPAAAIRPALAAKALPEGGQDRSLPLAAPAGGAVGAQTERTIFARLRELAAAFGPARDPGAVPAAAGVPAPALAPAGKPSIAPMVKDKKGVLHPLTFDPKTPRPPLWRRALASIRFIPEKVRRVRTYLRQIRDLVESVSDKNLAWSLGRMDALATQEGILRTSNLDLVNKWDVGDMAMLSPADFEGSSLSRESLMRTFKTAMDFEEPTLQYQYSFAQKLHNRHPRMSHFLGTTLQESVLGVALKGKAGQRAIWASEEVRHGKILVKVFNATRVPGQPPLFEQGTAPRLPHEGTESMARSNMGNRSGAELLAGSAYLVIRANAAKGSAAQIALDGLFRDEVYHYVIMSALNKFVYNQHSRWKRLFDIVRYELDDPVPTAIDAVIHRKRFPSLLHILETFVAVNAIDKRVDRYLRSLDPAKVRAMMGPFHRTDADVQAAVDRGEHQWTRHATMEQNPELSQMDVQRLSYRYPGFISAARREVRLSEIQAIIGNYRRTSLRNPNYWLRRKGFSVRPGPAGPTVIRRGLLDAADHQLVLSFEKAGRSPVVRVEPVVPGKALFEAGLDSLSMLQIGALMDAEDLGVLKKLGELKVDLSPEQLLRRLGRGPAYQLHPIRLVDDLTLSELSEKLLADPAALAALEAALRRGRAPGGAWPELSAADREKLIAALRGSDKAFLDSFPSLSVPALKALAAEAARGRGADPAEPAGPSEEELRLPGIPGVAPASETLEDLGGGFFRGDAPLAIPGSAYGDNKRLAEVMNRLASRGPGGGYKLSFDGRSYSEVSAFLQELVDSGHTIVAMDIRAFANFAHLHYRDGERLRPVVAPLFVDTGLDLPSGRRLEVPASHSHVEFSIRGPRVNANVLFYFGVDGSAAFRPLATKDQAWVGGRPVRSWVGDEAVRLAERAATARRELALKAEKHGLPLGGYGPLGGCEDVQAMLTGEPAYPQIRDQKYYDDGMVIDSWAKEQPVDGARPPDPLRVLASLPVSDPEHLALPRTRELVKELKAWIDKAARRRRSRP